MQRPGFNFLAQGKGEYCRQTAALKIRRSNAEYEETFNGGQKKVSGSIPAAAAANVRQKLLRHKLLKL